MIDDKTFESPLARMDRLKKMTGAAQRLVSLKKSGYQKTRGKQPLTKESDRPCRDYAIFCLLRDTPLTLNELCDLTLNQIKAGIIKLDSKDADINISKEAYRGIVDYIQRERPKDETRWTYENTPPPYLFLSIPQHRKRLALPQNPGRLTPDAIQSILHRIGKIR